MIEKYLANLQEIHSMTLEDFGDKRKVQRGNKLATENRRIAADIEKKHPELKEAFSQLLSHDDWQVRCQVAHHMLEVMNYPAADRKKAFLEILSVIQKDIPIHSLGNKMWLDQWYEKHPEDKFLLNASSSYPSQPFGG